MGESVFTVNSPGWNKKNRRYKKNRKRTRRSKNYSIKLDLAVALELYRIIFYFHPYQIEYIEDEAKPKTGKLVNRYDQRIKRIKLASFAYFIAEDEIAFYGLHWDLQQYRRCRELGFTGYPLRPYSRSYNRRRSTPKYLLRSTPNYLIGSVLIKRELEKLNLNSQILKTRKFITLCSKAINKEEPFSAFAPWLKNGITFV